MIMAKPILQLSKRITQFKNRVNRVIKDQRGTSAVEYSLLAAGMAVVVVTAIAFFGSGMDAVFDNISTYLLGLDIS